MALPNLGAHPNAADMETTLQREIRSNSRDHLLEGAVHGAVDIDASTGGTITPSEDERLANGLIRFTGSPSIDSVLEISETARQIELENTTGQDILTTTVTGDLLLENGVDSLQLEDGSGNLVLESSAVLVPSGETRIFFKDTTNYREVGRVGLQSGALLHSGAINPTGNVNFADFLIARAEMKDVAVTVSSPSSSSGTLILNLENGNAFDVTLTEDITTLTLSNPPASGKVGVITLIARQDGIGGHDITWPASVKWNKNVTSKIELEGNTDILLLEDGTGGILLEPFEDSTQITTADSVSIYILKTFDAGTTWYVVIAGADMR